MPRRGKSTDVPLNGTPEFPFRKGFQQLTRLALPARFNLGDRGEKCRSPHGKSLPNNLSFRPILNTVSLSIRLVNQRGNGDVIVSFLLSLSLLNFCLAILKWEARLFDPSPDLKQNLTLIDCTNKKERDRQENALRLYENLCLMLKVFIFFCVCISIFSCKASWMNRPSFLNRVANANGLTIVLLQALPRGIYRGACSDHTPWITTIFVHGTSVNVPTLESRRMPLCTLVTFRRYDNVPSVQTMAKSTDYRRRISRWIWYLFIGFRRHGRVAIATRYWLRACRFWTLLRHNNDVLMARNARGTVRRQYPEAWCGSNHCHPTYTYTSLFYDALSCGFPSKSFNVEKKISLPHTHACARLKKTMKKNKVSTRTCHRSAQTGIVQRI